MPPAEVVFCDFPWWKRSHVRLSYKPVGLERVKALNEPPGGAEIFPYLHRLRSHLKNRRESKRVLDERKRCDEKLLTK
jgi:hypothetical protein